MFMCLDGCCCFEALLLKEDWVFVYVVVVAVKLLELEGQGEEEGTNGSCEYTLVGIYWKLNRSSINNAAKLITDKSENAEINLGKLTNSS